MEPYTQARMVSIYKKIRDAVIDIIDLRKSVILGESDLRGKYDDLKKRIEQLRVEYEDLMWQIIKEEKTLDGDHRLEKLFNRYYIAETESLLMHLKRLLERISIGMPVEMFCGDAKHICDSLNYLRLGFFSKKTFDSYEVEGGSLENDKEILQKGFVFTGEDGPKNLNVTEWEKYCDDAREKGFNDF